MGISSGPTTKTTSQETANSVVAPTVQSWVSDPIQGLTGDISAYGNTDPYSYVAPLSQEQQQAMQGASNLGGWQDQLTNAGNLAGQAAGAGPNLAQTSFATAPGSYDAQSYAAPTVAGVNGPQTTQAQTYQYQAPTLGAAAQTQAATIDPAKMFTAQGGGASAAQIGTAAQASARGYDPTLLGDAQGYTAQGYQAPNLAAVQNMTASGYAPTQAQAAQLGQANQAGNVSLLDGGLDRYQNPFQQSVIDTTLADQDRNAAITRAQQAASAAKVGAFGGSRYGVEQAQTIGEQDRARLAADANLRSAGFDRATSLAQSDAALRGNIGMFNTQAQNTRDLTQGGFQQQANMSNADAANAAAAMFASATSAANSQNAATGNQFSLADAANRADASRFTAGAQNEASAFGANANNQFNLANQGASNDASAFGANAANTNSMFNAGQSNQQAQAQGQLSTQANIASAGNQTQASLANAAAGNSILGQNAGYQQQAGMFNAGASNDLALQQAQLQANAGQFNAGAQNAAGLQYAGAQNEAGLAQYQGNLSQAQQQAQLEAQAAQSNAGWANDALAQQYATQGQYGLANQAAANQDAQFNANQMDQATANQLQAAGLMNNIGNSLDQNQINDIQAQLAAGQISYQQAQAMLNAPVQQLNNQVQMFGGLPLGMFSGQTTNATTNSSGTSKTSGGLLQSLLGAGAQIGSAALMASERRVKRDIELLDREPDGLGIYRFNYVWDGPNETRRHGVMADEVEALRPWALGPVMNGIQTVDYSKLEAV